MIPFARPLIGPEEEAAVLRALRNPRLTEGPLVEEFERLFGEMHGGYAVAVTSCTTALYIASTFTMARNSRIKVPAMTHVATVHALCDRGPVIEFVDCDENGRCDEADIQVSFLGAPTRRSYSYMVDYACAVGLRSYSNVACYSFYPAKHITTGEGGIILCSYAEQAEMCRLKRAFGKVTRDGKFDVIAPGLNFRMSEINAAIGIEQLKKLPGWLEIRKRNWHVLAEELAPRLLPLDTSGGAYYCFSGLVSDGVDRDGVRAALLSQGVETSVYYPVPVPHLTYYRERYGHKIGDFPNAERIAARSICLPVAPHIGYNEIEQIISAVRNCL